MNKMKNKILRILDEFEKKGLIYSDKEDRMRIADLDIELALQIVQKIKEETGLNTKQITEQLEDPDSKVSKLFNKEALRILREREKPTYIG